MVILRSLLLVLEVLCSIMLIGLILLQKSKGGGLGTAFGGGGGDGSMFGSRTGNVLTKGTIILGLIFLVNTLILGMLFTSTTVTGESGIDRELMSEPTAQPEARTSAGTAPMPDEPLGMPAEDASATVPEGAPIAEPEVTPQPADE